MQKLSQARSELRLAAGSSDKGIQKLQFLKVLSRLDGRGEFSHRLRLAASSSSSFSISTVPSLCKLTRFAGKRLRKCDCDGEERRGRGGRRLKEKERRLKIGGGGLLLAVLVFQHRSRYVHIYIYQQPLGPVYSRCQGSKALGRELPVRCARKITRRGDSLISEGR